ncbi:MAG: hypothetical protein EXR62_04685 [Chloroflexi bacterium]|nr:hypothetical protein [Chloroflexota bacterium]
MQQRASDYEELKTNRVNFFLIVVAATITVLPTLIEKFQPIGAPGLLLIFLAVFLLALTTLNQVVEYSVSIVVFYRRAGRVRRWFEDQNKAIASYVAFPPRDDRPRVELSLSYLAQRGSDGILTTINSVSFTAIVLVVTYLYFSSKDQFWALIIGVVAFVTIWFLQQFWVRSKLRKQNLNLEKESHFPYTEPMKEIYDVS